MLKKIKTINICHYYEISLTHNKFGPQQHVSALSASKLFDWKIYPVIEIIHFGWPVMFSNLQKHLLVILYLFFFGRNHSSLLQYCLETPFITADDNSHPTLINVLEFSKEIKKNMETKKNIHEIVEFFLLSLKSQTVSLMSMCGIFYFTSIIATDDYHLTEQKV